MNTTIEATESVPCVLEMSKSIRAGGAGSSSVGELYERALVPLEVGARPDKQPEG